MVFHLPSFLGLSVLELFRGTPQTDRRTDGRTDIQTDGRRTTEGNL